jgi:AcrR family transcriptional regulator
MSSNPGAPYPPMAERRRDFVRLEIERAGMDLFAERGYGRVTVQDIAAAAGIGRRTFFRHFRSKEELLQAYDSRLALRALHALERRPEEESAAVALCNALVVTADIPSDQERIAFQRNKVLQEAGADTLIAGPPEVGQSFVDLTAARMGVDAGVDVRPHLVVWTVFAAARAATRFWIATDAKRTLKQNLESAFQHLLRGMEHI